MNLKIWKRKRRNMHYRNWTNRKIITGLLAIGVSASFLLAGCTDGHSKQPTKSQATVKVNNDDNFQERLAVGVDFSSKTVTSRIITDPKTGIEYIELYMNEDEAAGVSITPRLDKNGKPYINPKWRKNND